MDGSQKGSVRGLEEGVEKNRSYSCKRMKILFSEFLGSTGKRLSFSQQGSLDEWVILERDERGGR